MQTRWSDNDEDIIGRLVVHDNKLKLKNSNNEKDQNHVLPMIYGFFPIRLLKFEV